MIKKLFSGIALLLLSSTFLFAESLAFSYVTEKYEKPVTPVEVFFTDNDTPEQNDSDYPEASISISDLEINGNDYVLKDKDYLYYLVFKGEYAENILLEFSPMTNESDKDLYLEYTVGVDEVYPSQDNPIEIDEISIKKSSVILPVTGQFSTNSKEKRTYVYGFNYKFPVAAGSADDIFSTSAGTFVSEVKVTVNGGA